MTNGINYLLSTFYLISSQNSLMIHSTNSDIKIWPFVERSSILDKPINYTSFSFVNHLRPIILTVTALFIRISLSGNFSASLMILFCSSSTETKLELLLSITKGKDDGHCKICVFLVLEVSMRQELSSSITVGVDAFSISSK